MAPLTLAVITDGKHKYSWGILDGIAVDLVPIPVGDETLKQVQDCNPNLVLLPAWIPHRRQLSMEILLWGKAPLVWLITEYQTEIVAEASELGITGLIATTDSTPAIRWVLDLVWRTYKEEQRLRNEIKEVKEALETRKLVDRAKAALVEAWGITEAEAYRRMQRQAMNSRRTLRAVAESILEASGLIV